MNRPPISVTAHKGMDSKNPQSSTAVMISCGSTVACGLPKPAEFMIVLTTPWIISKIAIISSMP